ncbi:MAG: LamG-like jellyroll fold domain-containing protein [Caldilineaceae bacterium]
MFHRMILMLLLVTTLVSTFVTPAFAQTSTPCPLDVTFVIDETGSMIGAINSIKTDMASIITTINTVSGGNYQLGLVTFKDNVTVRNNLAAGNAAGVTTNINALTANGGVNTPEASDEALNTVINNLTGGGTRPQQTGNFSGVWRTNAHKLIILVTDALPAGFDDTYTTGIDDVNAHLRAVQGSNKNIAIAAVTVPGSPTPVAIMQDYANTTGGVYALTAANGSGAGAIIQKVIQDYCTCTQPPTNMVAWYPFDNKIFVANGLSWDVTTSTVVPDIQGLHHGTKQNSPVSASGKVQDALALNGVNQYVDVANATDLNFGTGDFAFDTWIRFPNGFNGIHPIVSKHSSNGLLSGYHWFVKNGQMALQMTSNGNAQVFFGPTLPNDGRWHFIAVTVHRAASGGAWYVDGNSAGVFTPLTGSLDNAMSLQIGKYTTIPTGEYYLNGQLDELEIFKRALTGNEVKRIFLADAYGKCKDPCPALAAVGKTDKAPADTAASSIVDSLRDLRDAVWSKSIAGQHYTGLYYQYSLRMTYLLFKDEALRSDIATLLQNVMPGVRELVSGTDGKTVITPELSKAVVSALTRLSQADVSNSDGQLAKVIEQEMQRVQPERLVGLTFAQAWKQIDATFTPPINNNGIKAAGQTDQTNAAVENQAQPTSTSSGDTLPVRAYLPLITH